MRFTGAENGETPDGARSRRGTSRARLGTVRDAVARAGAGDRPGREGLYRSGRTRRDDRSLRDQDRPAYRRKGRRQGVGGPGIQAGAPRRCDRGGARSRPDQPRGRSPHRGRALHHASHHDRLHVVLLLSVGSARPAAGLVQVGTVPLARGQRSARRSCGFRPVPPGGYSNPRLGFDRGDARYRGSHASCRERRLERGKTRAFGDPRLHDRHRAAEGSERDRLMDGVHDMGGMHGFGKVEPEQNEPVFHAEWESRCLALNRAMGAIGAWNIDVGRSGIEELPPEVYLTRSYYGKWALRLEKLVVKLGFAGADEIAAGRALRPGKTIERKFHVPAMSPTVARGSFA